MVENLTNYLDEVRVFTFSVRLNALASGNLRVNTQMKLNNNSGKENIKEVVVEILSRLTEGDIRKFYSKKMLWCYFRAQKKAF